MLIKRSKKVIALILLICISTAVFPLYQLSAESDYFEIERTEMNRPEEIIHIKGRDYTEANDGAEVVVGECRGVNDALIWKNDSGSISWSFDVNKAGNYYLRIKYYSLNENARNVQLSLKIDGKEPFSQAEQIVLPILFKNKEEIKQDENGNDIRPDQVLYNEWHTEPINDTTGRLNEPFSIELKAGVHTVTLTGELASIAIESLEFYNEATLKSYKEYSEDAEAYGKTYKKVIEAENTLCKTGAQLYPTYDRTSTDTSPSDAAKLRYNTVGGANFSSQGQYIVWEIDVKESGYYYLGARVRQNLSTDMVSYRRLYINGKVPFSEANSVKIFFSHKWQDYIFGAEEPWLIYFNKGRNLIKLEAVPGETAQLTAPLQMLLNDIGSFYRQVIMITGTSPDSYRDYYLDREIPEFKAKIENMISSSENILKQASDIGYGSAGSLSVLSKLSVMLESFLDKPNTVASRISAFNNLYASVSALLVDLQNQPLELDTITLASDVSALVTSKKGFFARMFYSFKGFIASFTEDYYSITNNGKKDSINVWVNLGRDQMTVLKNLCDRSFTPEKEISVNVSLVQQSLVQASLSGSGPDVVIFPAQADIQNLAMRNAVAAIDEFDSFGEVISRFSKDAMTPYEYNGHYYALPVTYTFPMMFVRTDIFSEMNISIPETWDDFYKVIRILQSSNLSAGIPNAESGNVMLVNTGIFATLLYQNGTTLYNDQHTGTMLDSEAAIEAFTVWTDFYGKYGLPYQYDFFNRFRSGDMPIGLSNYSLYGKLWTAAPEIKNNWTMAPIPGVRLENGDVNRSNCASGTGMIMLKGSKKQKLAWEFMDWFSDEYAQTQFGLDIETVLGPSGRYETANLKAFLNLPWTNREQNLIMSQWKNNFSLPQIPGSYIVDRNLVNAFRQVVFYNKNPRETIVSYNKTIENEIKRKRIEFGLKN